MKPIIVLGLLLSVTTLRAATVDVYTSSDVSRLGDSLSKKGGQFASADLARYANHYFMLAQRTETGSSELHEHEADVFVVESGRATLLWGGKLVNPRTQKPGEIRGTSIQGGEKRSVAKGDIIHIPAGTPHQLLVDRAAVFTYFVIKVTGQ